jgi:hypothetical protein
MILFLLQKYFVLTTHTYISVFLNLFPCWDDDYSIYYAYILKQLFTAIKHLWNLQNYVLL